MGQPPDLDRVDNFNYGNGASCIPSTATCPGLELAVYQVARNATMVPLKKSVARVYLRWPVHPHVSPLDQLLSSQFDITFKAADGTIGQQSKRGEWVYRSDVYSNASVAAGNHTPVFYFTPSTNTTGYIVEVTTTPSN